MATPTKRKKVPKVVTNAELLQRIEDVLGEYRALLKPPQESWDAFWKQCEATLFETTMRAWEDARRRSASGETAPPHPSLPRN